MRKYRPEGDRMKRKPVPKKLRNQILERDEHRCVLCWRKYQLDIHDFFDDPSNPFLPPSPPFKSQYPYANRRPFELITLCKSCHGKISTCDKHSPLYQLLVSIVKQNYEEEKRR